MDTNSLAIVVEQSMELDPFQRAVFAFCNRRCDRIKLLIYDRSGFWMLLTVRAAIIGCIDPGD